MGYLIFSPAQVSGLLFMPLTALLLLATFGILYIYQALTGQALRRMPQILGWIFVALATMAILYLGTGIGRTCTGLFATPDACTNVHWLTINVLLFNPFSVILWNVLAIAGSISLLKPLKSDSKE
jgi:hypothetical protein